MDDDLAAEIARIEAELARDSEIRQQPGPGQGGAPPATAFGFPAPQQQQQQQPMTTAGAAPVAAMGGGGAPVFSFGASPQAQQSAQVQPHPFVLSGSNPFAAPPSSPADGSGSGGMNANTGPAPSAMGAGGTAAAGTAHHFSKDSDGRSVFVGNLPKGENGGPTTTREELELFFSDCGPILNCTVLRDRTTQELKGTAYVEFASYAGMGQAIDTKNNAIFKGHTIVVC